MRLIVPKLEQDPEKFKTIISIMAGLDTNQKLAKYFSITPASITKRINNLIADDIVKVKTETNSKYKIIKINYAKIMNLLVQTSYPSINQMMRRMAVYKKTVLSFNDKKAKEYIKHLKKQEDQMNKINTTLTNLAVNPLDLALSMSPLLNSLANVLYKTNAHLELELNLSDFFNILINNADYLDTLKNTNLKLYKKYESGIELLKSLEYINKGMDPNKVLIECALSDLK